MFKNESITIRNKHVTWNPNSPEATADKIHASFYSRIFLKQNDKNK
jgi:hypothetical protein